MWVQKSRRPEGPIGAAGRAQDRAGGRAEGGLQGSVHSLLVLPGSPAAGRGCSGSSPVPLPPLPTDETEAPPWRCRARCLAPSPSLCSVLSARAAGARVGAGCPHWGQRGPWHPHAVPGLAPWQFQTPSPSHGVPSLPPRALLAEGLVPAHRVPSPATVQRVSSLVPAHPSAF